MHMFFLFCGHDGMIIRITNIIIRQTNNNIGSLLNTFYNHKLKLRFIRNV